MVSAGPTGPAATQRRRAATILYLDTSAFVKRYVAERGSPTVRAAMAAAPLRSTSVVTFAETHSALLRAQRDGRLDAAGYAASVALVTAHWPGYVRLAVDDALVIEAGRLVVAHARFALRGFDAIHLASAHRLADGRPDSVTFACWDLRLWRAARSAGFRMLPAREPS